MASVYDHTSIEKKWQKEWEEQKLYETPDSVEGKKNFYTLVEFPYPSGDLHIGHWYAYSVPDVFTRMKRMQGFNVLYPIGFDAFGLPAENAAIKRNISPEDWTYDNIEKMRTQMHSMGASFDWSRQVITSDPSYYRFTQWLFLKFYEKGLAYSGRAFVNWCPTDQTVLADEQVIDGECERCSAKVEKRELTQWFFKITHYAERLLKDIDELDWPRAVKESQKNWIGKSEGSEIDFAIPDLKKPVTVFTTRADTLYGATYIVVAPEHPLLSELLSLARNREDVESYVKQAKLKPEIERTAFGHEKTGIPLEGVTAINPGTGEIIPLWVADYVLSTYGTGAVMGVPAHDERDFEFAKKYELPIRPVIRSGGSIQKGWTLEKYADEWNDHYSNLGKLYNSAQFDGLNSEDAKEKITAHVGGNIVTKYKLHDWLISRQRYWGTPIPIVYDPHGEPHAVPEEHLPWLLPDDAEVKPKGVSPLESSRELRQRTERIFGKGWTPETDTMDGFVDNSWYFLRYLDPKNEKEFSSIKNQKAWMPITRYSGGAEHTTVHVLYSRFFYKALYDLGLVTESEPFKIRLNRGIILAEDGRKMSKRWGNVINPDEQVANFGADAVRTYLAFIGPYNEVGSFPWSTNGLVGVRRFLERVYGFKDMLSEDIPSPVLETLLNQTIKKVGEDIESMKFNTCVSTLMIFSNELGKQLSIPKSAYETLLKLLAPFAPHLTEELWHHLGKTKSIHAEEWPHYDSGKLKGEEVTIAVQIRGKTKGTIRVPHGASQDTVIELLKNNEKMAQILPKNPKRVIFVAGRIINFIA